VSSSAGGFGVRRMNLFDLPAVETALSVWKDPRMSSDMSIDQARMAFLALSLAQIATQQQKLSLEISTIRKMRRELAMKGSARVLQMADGLRSIEGRINRPSITGPGNLTRRSPGGSFLLPYLRRSQLPTKARRRRHPPAGFITQERAFALCIGHVDGSAAPP
jgi:hypothetical protein